MKKVGFLITARLKSTRLPLKLLKEINGKTIIEQVIDRIKKLSDIEEIILCTSINPQDKPLIDIAKKNSIYYFNGDEEDVLSRLLTAAKLYDLDYFIGITGENPLFSLKYTNKILQKVKETDSDFIYVKGLPIGCATYALKTKALEVVCKVKNVVDTEIWGYLINRPEVFDVHEIIAEPEYTWSDLRITIDYEEDFNFIKRIFKDLSEVDRLDLKNVLFYLKNNPDILNIHAHRKQADLGEELKNKIDDFFKNNRQSILELKNKIYK